MLETLTPLIPLFFIIIVIAIGGFLIFKLIKKAYNLFINVLIIFFILFVVFGTYTILIEPNNIVVKNIQINDTGTNMKIVFLSDFQRADNDSRFVERVVELVNKENADLILLGGDYVMADEYELPSIEPLKKLKAKYGIYGVMGNHDYNMVVPQSKCPGQENLILANNVKKFLEENGTITVLSNENRKFGSVTLIALNDLFGCQRNETKALLGSQTGYRILLSHNQDELEISNKTADIYLFGHTHCGQIRIPGIGSLPKVFGFAGEYDAGYYMVNGSHVYTTCGFCPGPRLFAPPEITVIELDY